MSASVATHTAAVLHGPKDMRLEQRPLLPPGQGECTVQVVSTGLCGSDLHYYTHGRNGDFALQAPLVLGHESAGVITAVGPGVRDLVVGQRVAIEAGVMCNACDFCRGRRYNLCKRLRFCSSAKTFPHLDGTLQTAINHPAHVLHPLPDACTFDQAALAEPLSVLLHAARRANLASGQSVLVYGVGAIGLLAAALARALGARRVCAVDINPQRLALSTAEGYADAAHCLPTNLPPPANADEALARAKTNADTALEVFKEADGFDVVFECTGAEPCIQMAIHTAITGGKVMLVGMGARNVTLPLSSAALREVDIQGSFRYAHTYPEALELLGKRSVRVEPLVTHRFPLERAADAFALLAKGRDEQGKVVLKVMVDGAAQQ